jgi:hypothetical protein
MAHKDMLLPFDQTVHWLMSDRVYIGFLSEPDHKGIVVE